MVILFEWHRTAVDLKSSVGLPMTSEDTGLGAVASPLAGYLGKVQERAASLEHCPWCTSKGLTCALRSYHINLQESLTLCTNPLCLFPLVSRSLEDVLASLDPVEPTVGNKRKTPLPLEEATQRTPKRLRSSELDGSGTETDIFQAERCASNGHHTETDANGCDIVFDCPVAETTCGESMEDEKVVLDKEPGAFRPSGFLTNGDVHSTGVNLPPPQLSEQMARTEQECEDMAEIHTGLEEFFSSAVKDSEGLVSVPAQLFWPNRDNLCWLDSLLAALVNCRSLRKRKPVEGPHQSSVWQMINVYEEISAAVQVHHQTGADGVARVPNHVLQKANAELQSLRMSVFKLLQPKLQCKLGQRETPVFAMPLLLAMDSWVESLFQSTFIWEFTCSKCRAATVERFVKTLPTFTNIAPGWSPLQADHVAPCNVCRSKCQKRTMILESVPPVFMLHFVEGLPDNDVTIYAFDFEGKRYSITTVIQYNQQLKHFVTWIHRSDGSWLEYDDLKHPDCKTHHKLPVPAREMHLVFWEAKEDEEPRVCSPTSTFTELLACSPDRSLVASHNDTDILCALSEDGNDITDATLAANDASIGSTTLLDTFEGLNHNDIITLTLVELKTDLDITPAGDNEQTRDSSAPLMNDAGSVMCHGPVVDPPAIHNSSDPTPGEGSSSDPSFLPSAPTGRGRRRGAGTGKTDSKSSKATPLISPPPESPKPSKATNKKSKTTKTMPPVPPTDSSPPSNSHNIPTSQLTVDQNARWSFLLSKRPLGNIQNPIPPRPAPSRTSNAFTPVKPPAHSTPNPVRRQQTPAVLYPKPQLRTEESEALPLKAAEKYGAFGAKSPPAPLLCGKPNPGQPLAPLNQSPLLKTTVLPTASLPVLRTNGHPEISACKKQSSHSSKVPPGLSDTEALRYKLLKKLKAKKKKLAKLNELLGAPDGASLRPDSSALGSPNTVTSSTFDGSTCDDLLSDLLSPATTASNLSPDSTGFLEMLTKGADAVGQLDCGVGPEGALSQTNVCVSGGDGDDFMDEFLSQAVAQRPTEMESDALSALDLFM